MGIFESKKVAEENVLEGATEWFKEQVKTSDIFDKENKKMEEEDEGKDTPKRARIFIAVEENDKRGMIITSMRASTQKVMLNAFFKNALQDKTFANLIKATAAKLELVEELKKDIVLPAGLKDAMEHLIKIL